MCERREMIFFILVERWMKTQQHVNQTLDQDDQGHGQNFHMETPHD